MFCAFALLSVLVLTSLLFPVLNAAVRCDPPVVTKAESSFLLFIILFSSRIPSPPFGVDGKVVNSVIRSRSSLTVRCVACAFSLLFLRISWSLTLLVVMTTPLYIVFFRYTALLLLLLSLLHYNYCLLDRRLTTSRVAR